MIKATQYDPDLDVDIASLKQRIESYRSIYDKRFFDDLVKKFKVSPDGRISFESSILAAAENYNKLLRCNENIEPAYQAKSKISSLQKKLISIRDEYDKFLEAPEATVDEFFMNLDRLYEEGKHQRFFEYLHDHRYRGGGTGYNLKSIIEFFEALIDAAQNAEDYYQVGQSIKKNDPFPSWLRRMEELFYKYSEIQFTQGKYHKGVGYVSECLNILHKIMHPLDPNVTEQKLANKLKQYNDKKARK